MDDYRSLELRGARILVSQVVFGVFASSLVIGGVLDDGILLAALKTAGGVAAVFIVIAMIREKDVDIAIATSWLAAVGAILSLLTALPSFVFTIFVIISIATAVLAARLARHDWIVRYEPFLFTLCRALPALGIVLGAVLDIISGLREERRQ